MTTISIIIAFAALCLVIAAILALVALAAVNEMFSHMFPDG